MAKKHKKTKQNSRKKSNVFGILLDLQHIMI